MQRCPLPPCRIIDDVDEDVNRLQTQMDVAMEGLQKLLKTKDTRYICAIFILTLIALGLLFAVFYGL